MNTVVGAARVGKTFVNEDTQQRYSSDFNHHFYTTTRIVDFDFFNKASIESFKKFELIGWGPFFSLIENIYLDMIKEFYSNLIFDSDGLRATFLIKGRKVELSQVFLVDILKCPNDDIERYFIHKEVPYEGYLLERAIHELMEGKVEAINVSQLNVSNRVLLHAISQKVLPSVGKSNTTSFLEIFYC